jgi:TolB-like protein
VAIVNIKSGNNALSEYIMENMPISVLRNSKKIQFVDRGSTMDLLRKEISYQYSGEVDDSAMVSIGHQLGAQFIVSGTIVESGSFYEFNIKVLDVKTAALINVHSTKVEHDEVMARYLPNSTVAQNRAQQAQADKEKRDKTTENVKTALGLFSRGFYLGYTGSFGEPFGASIGWLGEGAAFFMDANFCTPSFQSYEKKSEHEGFSLSSPTEETALRLNLLAGLNIRIIKTLLWINVGAGFEYSDTYQLYAKGDTKVWSQGDSAEQYKFIVAPGILIKIWYLYVQAKYVYVMGDEVDFDVDKINVGAGFVWRRK